MNEVCEACYEGMHAHCNGQGCYCDCQIPLMKTITGVVWSNLSIKEKLLLLKSTYPQRSPALLAFEANKTWKNLLPSTKADLKRACQRNPISGMREACAKAWK